MKKLFVLLLLMSAATLWAQDIAVTYKKKMDMDIGVYLVNHNAAGSILDLTTSAIGGGLAVEYPLYVFPLVGFSGRLEGSGFIPQSVQAGSWGSMVFAAGVFGNFEVLPFLTLRPELSYGGWVHIVNAPERGVKGAYVDSMLQIAPSVRIKPAPMAEKNLSLEVSPLYTLLMEKENLVHLLGVRVGLFYTL